MEERTDANEWYYERVELNGMEVWGTGAALVHNSVPDMFYCYDLYGTGNPEDCAHNFVSKDPVEKDFVGTVLTVQPLQFQEKEFIRLESLRYFYDEPMCTLEQVMSKLQMAENQQLQAGCQMQGI